MNAKEIVRRLKEHGWEFLRQEGSHIRMGKGTKRASIPMHGKRDIKPGTLASIERQAGIKLK